MDEINKIDIEIFKKYISQLLAQIGKQAEEQKISDESYFTFYRQMAMNLLMNVIDVWTNKESDKNAFEKNSISCLLELADLFQTAVKMRKKEKLN